MEPRAAQERPKSDFRVDLRASRLDFEGSWPSDPPGFILKAPGPDFDGPGLDFGASLRKMILQPRKREKCFHCKHSGDHTEQKANAKANAKAKVKGKATAEAKAEQSKDQLQTHALHFIIA